MCACNEALGVLRARPSRARRSSETSGPSSGAEHTHFAADLQFVRRKERKVDPLMRHHGAFRRGRSRHAARRAGCRTLGAVALEPRVIQTLGSGTPSPIR